MLYIERQKLYVRVTLWIIPVVSSVSIFHGTFRDFSFKKNLSEESGQGALVPVGTGTSYWVYCKLKEANGVPKCDVIKFSFFHFSLLMTIFQ